MTGIDTAKHVLAKASLFDQTFSKPDLGTLAAWAQVFGELDRDDAVSAVNDHYTNSTDRLMPAHVIAGVRRIRKQRILDAHDLEPVDADPSDVRGYIAAVKDHRRAIGDGKVIPIHTAERKPRSDEVKALMQATLSALPVIPEIDPEEIARESRGGVS